MRGGMVAKDADHLESPRLVDGLACSFQAAMTREACHPPLPEQGRQALEIGAAHLCDGEGGRAPSEEA